MTEVRIPLLKRPLARLASAMTFQQQLNLVVAAGVLSMTILSSLASAWQAIRLVEGNLLQQSLQVASSVAMQSQLALLSSTAENAGEAMSAALAFPDVARIEVRGLDDQVLAARGAEASLTPVLPPMPERLPHQPFVAAEDAASWLLVAPVWSTRSSSPFEVAQVPDELLGHVVLSISKQTLARTVTGIVLTHVITSLVIALVFLWVLRALAERLNRPLRSLSQAMASAEQGEVHVRTAVQGPSDLQRMSHAFNRMISALQDRGEELQRHQNNLEELVRERTAELKVAKERAEVASQAKTDFLTRMSHELRTPLNAIMGYAQILEMDRALSDRQRHIVQTMHESGDHLLKLIIDILDLSRIESGHTELHVTAVQLSAMVSQLDNALQIKAREQGLTLETLCADTIPEAVLVDDMRLRQVLYNLLGNALKFTAQGSVRLEVLCPVPSAGDGPITVRFAVHDTGPGIRAADQARIFEPFEQAGDARSRAQGTGLGLAISRQLVRLMGGELRLHCEEGCGSTFWFDLPLTPTLVKPAPQRLTATVTGYEGPRRKVLIADDVAANRHLLVELLRPLGFDTIEATDGQEAIQAWQAHAPELVLMDQAMPGMDGLSATRHLRDVLQAHDTVIVILTAHASAQNQTTALEAGADAFLAKPFEWTELLVLIGQHLRLTWRQAALTAPSPEPQA